MWQRDWEPLNAEWTLNAGNCYYWLSMKLGCWNLIKLFSWLIYYESCILCHAFDDSFSPFFLFIHIQLHFVIFCSDQWTIFTLSLFVCWFLARAFSFTTFKARKPNKKKRKKEIESISVIEKFNLKRLLSTASPLKKRKKKSCISNCWAMWQYPHVTIFCLFCQFVLVAFEIAKLM